MVAEERNLPTVIEQDDLVPRFVMSIQAARAQLAELRSFVKEIMIPGEDYGIIPGTGDKPTLLKPGAEKLNEIYGYAAQLEVVQRIEDWQAGFFHYEVKCSLLSKRTGTVIAEGVGSCNSKEKRYSDRWVFESDLPDDIDKRTLKTKEVTSKKNGRTYTMYLWVNEDPYTLVNTILKMAKKRAYVDATLSATRSSALFTQDVEDMTIRGAAPENTTRREPTKPEPVRKEGATPAEVRPIRTTEEQQYERNIKQAIADLGMGDKEIVALFTEKCGKGAKLHEMNLENLKVLWNYLNGEIDKKNAEADTVPPEGIDHKFA